MLKQQIGTAQWLFCGGFALGVQMLQCAHSNGAALSGGDSLGGGVGGGKSSHSSDAVSDGGASNRLVVKEGIDAIGRIHNQLNLAAFDQIHYVGAAFFDFVNAIDGEAGGFDHV